MNIDYRDKSKPITAEDLIRRYKLDDLKKDRKAIQTNRNALDKTDTIINEFVDATLKDIKELQDQVDGNIMTWFFSGVPTLENQPANEWLNEAEKINHLGDLYYDKETGFAYRFSKEEEIFSWIKLKDSDIAEALAIANSAQDTADSKRRVFVVEPSPPYEVGDIWIKEDKDLYRCRTKRIEGEFNEVDWVRATDYSNDDYAKEVEGVLNQFKETVEKDYVTTVLLETTKDSIDAKVQANTTETRRISNDLLSTNEKFNNYATKEMVTTQIDSVETKLTSNEFKINVINETLENGISKVKTNTGYTFGDEGLNIGSSNSKVNNTLNEKGMEITDNTTNDTLLYAGYDSNLQETIVRSKNMTVEKYLKVPHARYEKYNNPTFGEGTGCFYVD